MSKKLDAENEGEGDLRGLQTAIKCAAARDTGREKTSFGHRWVESPAESEADAVDEVDAEPEEDRVQTLRAEALEQMDSYL